MSDEFRIMIASDDDHGQVFAEIYLGDKFIALVNQEAGRGKEEIELPATGLDESQISRKIPLCGFEKALRRAVLRLRGGEIEESAGSR